MDSNRYSVAFRDQKYQQAVLKNLLHDVEGLVLTVRDSPRSCTCSSRSQDFTAPVEAVPVLRPPPPDEKYQQTLDPYIIRYIKDCPKAQQELGELLDSFDCYPKVKLKKGRVSVKRSTQCGSKDKAGTWKEELDRFFGGFQCCYETDRQRMEALFESCQTPDKVHVYREGDSAVVVGKRSEVKARMKKVEERLRLNEKATSHQRHHQLLAPRETEKSISVSQYLSEGTGEAASNSLQDGLQNGLQDGFQDGFQDGLQVNLLVSPTVGHDSYSDGAVSAFTSGSRQNFQSSLNIQLQRDMKPVCEPSLESTPKRIALLGKTGSGKSSLANTMFGKEVFTPTHSANRGTSQCQAVTRSVHGRNVTLIDTPGLFDTEVSEEELKSEVVRCITECSPGPHAFLIVLKVERFTEQEDAVITKICQYFSEDALKYAVIVFTHGDQLQEGMTIEKFVSENKKLSELVQKCGGRCHVIDNKYWEKDKKDKYRDNCVQVKKLLSTIDKMVMENNGGCYTNKMLQVTQREIQKEEELIRQMCGGLTEKQISTQAKAEVHSKFLVRLAGVGTGTVVGAFFGFASAVGVVITAVRYTAVIRRETGVIVGGRAARLLAGGVVAGGAVVGGVMGGVAGYQAAEEAETVMEAVEKAADEVNRGGQALFNRNKPLLP